MAPKGYGENVQNILVRLKAFFEQEKGQGEATLLQNVNMRMELATGISRTTIQRLLKPKKDLEQVLQQT